MARGWGGGAQKIISGFFFLLTVVDKDAPVNYYLEYSEDRVILSWNLTIF